MKKRIYKKWRRQSLIYLLSSCQSALTAYIKYCYNRLYVGLHEDDDAVSMSRFRKYLIPVIHMRLRSKNVTLKTIQADFSAERDFTNVCIYEDLSVREALLDWKNKIDEYNKANPQTTDFEYFPMKIDKIEFADKDGNVIKTFDNCNLVRVENSDKITIKFKQDYKSV